MNEEGIVERPLLNKDEKGILQEESIDKEPLRINEQSQLLSIHQALF